MSAPEQKNDDASLGWIVFSAVAALAIVGYFVGIGPSKAAQEGLPRSLPEASGQVLPAVPWGAIKQGNLSPNAGWKTTLSMAGNQTREPLQDRPAQTQEQTEASLRARAARRAFAGAPPRTPHSVAGMSVYACQSCHGNGLSVNNGQVVAPQMPHTLFINCLQCHETLGEQPPGGPPTELEAHLAGNSFAGAAEPKAGPRYLPNAPPQVPHSSLMRTNCLSCHGALGQQGIKSSHTWRQNCQQCHTTSASLDQRAEAPESIQPPTAPPVSPDM